MAAPSFGTTQVVPQSRLSHVHDFRDYCRAFGQVGDLGQVGLVMLRSLMRFDRSDISIKLIKDVTMIVQTVAPNVPTHIAGLCPALRRHADKQFSKLKTLARVGHQDGSNL
jgi:hypothetical protein